MEIDDEIKLFGFELGNQFPEIFIEEPCPGDKGIRLQQGMILFFCKVMDLRVRKLSFQATDHRACQNDIPDGTEPDDQDLFQRINGLFCFSYPIEVSGP